jgi:hypothetical protein
MKSLELLHYYLLLFDLNESGHFPPNVLGHDGRMFASSMRTVAISWLATFVDQSRDGMNVFDLWRRLFPKHKDEIDRVWAQLEPQLELIKNFRDRVGFHADTPLKYFAARDKIRGKNPELQAAMDSFINLEIALYKYEDEELPDFVSAAEELLLDVELHVNETTCHRSHDFLDSPARNGCESDAPSFKPSVRKTDTIPKFIRHLCSATDEPNSGKWNVVSKLGLVIEFGRRHAILLNAGL